MFRARIKIEARLRLRELASPDSSRFLTSENGLAAFERNGSSHEHGSGKQLGDFAAGKSRRKNPPAQPLKTL
jgi:hypothetical protein